MELFCPGAGGIELARIDEEVEGEAFLVFLRDGFSGASAVEDVGGLRIGAGEGGAAVEAVVGESGTGGVEVVVAFLEGGEEIGEVGDGGVGGLFEAVEPLVEEVRAIYLEGFVGAEGGDDFAVEV